MRTTLLVAVSILAVAFAGCTDEPPKGEFSSTGNALVLAGTVATFDSMDFNNPYPETDGTLAECAQDDQASLPGQIARCQRPYTVLDVNFTNLPDPQGKTYSVKFYSMSSGAQEDISVLDNVHQMDGAWMGTAMFDNTADCSASKDSEACNKANKFDSVVLYLDDILVASAALSSGAAFEFDAGLLGASFTGSYSGKDLTLTVAGLGNYTYEAWLITADADGVLTHEEKFAVTNGETTFKAAMSLDKYAGVHIHVANTKLNVAVATIS